jgi:serine/threonine protein kinase
MSAAGGSSGWQAPEQLMAKDGSAVRQSRAMDVFSLGCVMYYCLTAGKHPFGEHYERDTNILRGLCNLAPLHKWPEAYNLVRGKQGQAAAVGVQQRREGRGFAYMQLGSKGFVAVT